MSLADRIYNPFEKFIRPLDIPFQPLPTDNPFLAVLHFAKLFRSTLILIALLNIAVEAINLSVIWGMSFIVDGVSNGEPAIFLAQNWPILAGLGVLIFPVMPIFIFIASALSSQSVGVCMPAAVQWQGHKAVERQDLAFFHDVFAGQVANRINQVASAVQQQLVVAFQSIPHFLMQFVGSLGLLIALSWQLAVPAFIWMAANVTIALIAVPHFSERSSRSAQARSLAVGAMTDLYANIQLVKLFAAEDSEAGAIRNVMTNAIETQQKERRIFLTTDNGVVTLNVLLWFSVVLVGLWGLAEGFVTAGEFAGAVYIVQRLSSNGRAFLQIGQQIFQAIGTIRDAMPVMTTKPMISDTKSAVPLKVTNGAIHFSNVNFQYLLGKEVLRDVSFLVKPGEKVGIVGVSGAGKTTLINLLLRFFDPEAGRIEIDGQDIRSVTQASLRQSIGVITQDVMLLHRSAGDNIRYGRPDASDEELRKAAALAQADDFIAELKDNQGRIGYGAFVGDRGIKLSGGQRQRVAIARVFLKDAPILVLDEATSALDSASEAAIQERLYSLMKEKTVIAIAHRLSTIAEMDRILVLDRGRIVEEGTVAELVKRDGLFARLWARQTGGYLADAVE
ncbi:ABC transporter ATP-binding protein [Agrobacterium sp. CCNWLW71]|uniref:ABC transporter ATP-binding protein n=1 Tax=unclassified Agrobacterium TaxID=2632611 RepID=UPI002FF18FF1